MYDKIAENIDEGNAEDVMELVKDAIKMKYPPENILKKGVIGGIEKVAARFKTEEVLVPEVLLSTRAAHAGLFILKPYLKSKNNRPSLKILMGVVSGDVHDIGKDIVKTVISTLDVEVIDLGINVSRDKFIAQIEEKEPDIVMISALLTTTMPEIKDVIDGLIEKNIREKVTVFIGGGPVTEGFRKRCKADYFIPDVIELRDFIEKNMSKFKK